MNWRQIKTESLEWAKVVLLIGFFLLILVVAIVKEFAPTVAFLKYVFGG